MASSSVLPLNRKIMGIIVLLLVVGQIMLFSATGVLGLQRHGSEFYFFSRSVVSALVGLAFMLLLSRVKYQLWQKTVWPILICQLVLIALTFTPLGRHALGASRWLNLGSFSFQPSEGAKITISIYVAYLLARQHQARMHWKQWALHLIPIVLMLLLILRQPDLGTTILLSSVFLGMLFIAGMKPVYMGTLIGGSAVVFVISMLHSEYRRKRLFAFLNPWADPHGNGFQMIQSYLSFHSGKLFGLGLGNGNSKLFYLPEVHTDFIFALIGEELGFIGAVLLIFIFAHLTYLLFKVSFLAQDPFARYLSFGLALALSLQVAVNLGGVTGLLPVKGLPLPFLSWGRTALIVNLAMMGILLNIVRQHERPPHLPDPPPLKSL